MDIVEQIKRQIEQEHKDLGQAPEWFFDKHLLGVEHFAKILLEKLPEANKEIVLLGVWLHDLQRIRGVDGDHEQIGAEEAEKVLREHQYSPETIEQVKEIIACHRCKDSMPATIEGKILASADAMSHYINDFYLRIATTGQRNVEEFKEWALKKLDRDYNKKIHFDFAREMIQDRHDTLIKLLTEE